VCNTYGAWFATGALTLAREFRIGDQRKIDLALKKGYDFLISKQHSDGSWGEDFRVRDQFDGRFFFFFFFVLFIVVALVGPSSSCFCSCY
jgi:hypothetical protein